MSVNLWCVECACMTPRVHSKAVGEDSDGDPACHAHCVRGTEMWPLKVEVVQPAKPVEEKPMSSGRELKLDLERVRTLREQGASIAAIADELGVSPTGVRGFLMRNGLLQAKHRTSGGPKPKAAKPAVRVKVHAEEVPERVAPRVELSLTEAGLDFIWQRLTMGQKRDLLQGATL